jgi:DNA-binding PadR family transcriptional regulator
MRYSLYINQPVALDLGIENTTEAIIFDYLTIASTWAKPEIIDNKVYYWVERQKICDEHKILDLKPKTVYRYLRKLHQKGLIDYQKLGKKDCIAITELGKTYISSTMGNKNSSPMWNLNSHKEELKFPSDGNKNSTYKYTNPIHLSDNSLSKGADFLKSQNSFINYMRATFKNKTIATTDQYTGKKIQVAISDKGYLYDKITGENFAGTRALEMWEKLYEFAIQNPLAFLKQNEEETA